MTQSPLPYPPPHQPAPALADPMAPARRAAVLMWVFGAIAVLGGVFIAIGGNSVTPEELAKVRPESAEQARMMEQQLGITLQTVYLVMGLAGIAVGGVVGGVAFLVRRGGMGAVVTGIVLTAMLLVLMLLFALSMLVAGGAEGVAGLCMLSVPTALLAYQLTALIQAARSASRAALVAQAQRPQGQHPHAQPHAQGYGGQSFPPPYHPAAPPAQAPPGYGNWGYGSPGQHVSAPAPTQQVPPQPPPGQPPVQFGYATRPPPTQPPAQTQQPPAQHPSAAPPADSTTRPPEDTP